MAGLSCAKVKHVPAVNYDQYTLSTNRCWFVDQISNHMPFLAPLGGYDSLATNSTVQICLDWLTDCCAVIDKLPASATD